MKASHLIVLSLIGLLAGWASGSEALDDPGLITITVAADRGLTLAHVIRIDPAAPITARSTAELDEVVWTATRTSQRGVTIIKSDACPALKDVVLSLSRLPAIPVAPPMLRVRSPLEQVPPVRKDGFSTRMAFSTETSDGSLATIEVESGNAYANWSSHAVAKLLACWGPLRP
ncbi:hypothetical protein [Caulobacter mirabilis]|uniref:Uncharacterized protein n=1 Tax=Caulobacter mirabilis TaxID=69666 RepID=A0A2D2AVS0_9CAUL|nr:hypothetical protein [Caulobacter mirabilis]ATQ42057.1 hypothetical protein CSW64_06320 [Caulobacter mirabilis]